ncbi:hypothetical protein LF1_56100 [Rubripirellula obstinata]|uniref:Uncharacterized protein n=1 Tax=Rubripirellula obstinata TaxID=406547 RepID=A0A5B1CC98_9BACT|nr:hypothetical protein [Rubripirellula obstinata]KAA1256961.1 hypothetical protein LF1_57420 [Rubripirellula obstinata]KAA1257210.1 hypothetical protein LF1_56100 [Rubripirellula obstinata]
MNINPKWSIAAYVGITLYVALWNLTVDTATTKIVAPKMTGQNIPTPYLASLPAVANNRGVVPPGIQKASVTAYVVETHRGWPWRIEDNYGYRYDVFNTTTGYTATVSGFPTKSGLNTLNLIVNFLGTLAVFAVLHLSVLMAVRSFHLFDSAIARPQADG